MLAPEAVPSGLASAVGAILGDPAYRTAARTLAAQAQGVGHGELATDLVDALAGVVSRR
jgi:hypothetical protein